MNEVFNKSNVKESRLPTREQPSSNLLSFFILIPSLISTDRFEPS